MGVSPLHRKVIVSVAPKIIPFSFFGSPGNTQRFPKKGGGVAFGGIK